MWVGLEVTEGKGRRGRGDRGWVQGEQGAGVWWALWFWGQCTAHATPATWQAELSSAHTWGR